MRVLVISGYPAWEKVSKGLMPAHHLFGINELIDHYEQKDGRCQGILKNDVTNGGYVDFYQWKSGKANIIKQIIYIKKISHNYDLIYDQLNRCSIYLGFLKKLKMLNIKLITILHHPPYDIQLKVSDSDAYIFFNNDYLALAKKANPEKKERYFVNEWTPDIDWYKKVEKSYTNKPTSNKVRFIDTGKSRRDRKMLMEVAEENKIRIDYAGDETQMEGFARSYCMDLKDDIGMAHRIMDYDVVLIPVQENKKNKIGPLGITSFLDCIALKKPVIASDNVCFAQEIDKKRIGIIYNAGDKESFANALKRISENDCLYSELLNNIRIYKYKSMSDYSKNLLKIVQLVLNEK